jgi:hypothetical protein
MDALPTSLFLFLLLRCLSYAETAITLIVGASKLCADCERLDSLVIWSIIRANFQQLPIFGGSQQGFSAAPEKSSRKPDRPWRRRRPSRPSAGYL